MDDDAQSISSPAAFESSPVYHTPTHRDSSSSRMLEDVCYEELEESADSQDSSFILRGNEMDAFGFIRTGQEWTNVLTGETYSHNPYEL